MSIPAHLQVQGRLVTYRPEQQHSGTFVLYRPWTFYCTGTFRPKAKPEDDHEASVYLDRFMRAFCKAMHFRPTEIAYYAALEHRISGLGCSPVRRHWHLLLACPDHPLAMSVAEELWWAINGRVKIEPYDRRQCGAYYINKLISEGVMPYERNLQLVPYEGPTDLIEAAKHNPFVPDHLKEKTTGEYLVVR